MRLQLRVLSKPVRRRRGPYDDVAGSVRAMTLANRPIGPVDAPGGQLLVSPQGLGCMSMSIVYGLGEDESGTATIHRALDMGVRLLDTADLYGGHANEVLVGQGHSRSSRRGHPRHQVRHHLQRRLPDTNAG